MQEQGWSSHDAKNSYHVQDLDWELDLAERFSTIAIDEAHVIKNAATASHSTVQGYMTFIQADPELWHNDQLKAWGPDNKVNPFALPDNHPATALRMTFSAMEHFIIKANNEILAGVYLRKIWPKCMIRRTYASKNPRFPGQVVGQAIPSLYSRKVLCPFATNEQGQYDQFSELLLRKLMTMLPDGTLVWNRKYSRQLILNSSWLGFHYIGDDINASSIKKWKDDTKPKLLYRWVKMLHIRMKEKNAPEQWQLPREDDVPALLAIVCRGSPKLHATLRIVAELVILHEKKWILWCSLPASQLLLFACFQALNSWSVCYTSELSRGQRCDLVKAFTDDPKCRLFIGSWHILQESIYKLSITTTLNGMRHPVLVQ